MTILKKVLRLIPFIAGAIGLIPLQLSAQRDQVEGDGNTTTITRSLDNFTQVDSRGSYDVILIQGSTTQAKIEGEDNLIPYIITDVSGGKLEISSKEHTNLHFTKPLKIYITVPSLEKISLGGSGDIKGDGPWKVDKMKIDLMGSGDIDLSFTAGELSGNIMGSGDMKLDLNLTGTFSGSVTGSGDLAATGSADRAELSVTGSGDIDVKKLTAKSWDSKVIGSGDISR